jgi:hypothetical protein
MKRLLPLTLVGSLLLSVIGCGAVFIGGAIQPATTIQGSVTNLQLGNMVNEAGGSVLVTFVTFFQSGTSSTLAFCNNQTNRLPLNQTVNVNFTPGQPCATIIVVAFVSWTREIILLPALATLPVETRTFMR